MADMMYTLCSVLLFFVTVALAQDDGDSGAPPTNTDMIKTAHASLSAVSWMFFFPLGSILIRVLSVQQSVWIHAGIQIFATVLFTAGVGLGIQLALIDEEVNTYHAIIGLVVFSVVFFQAIAGLLHHVGYKKRGRRAAISHIHIWLGRVVVTLGMINGGLGLLLAADASRADYIAYGVIAGSIWSVWVGVDLWATFVKTRTQSGPPTEKGGATG